jgi:hypothetical protein
VPVKPRPLATPKRFAAQDSTHVYCPLYTESLARS